MSVKTEKQQLREKIFHQRDNLAPLEKKAYDDWFCAALWKKVQELNATCIHVFLPMRSEPDIRPFIQKALDHQLTVVAPQTLRNRKLQHLELKSLSSLEKGLWGTMHPLNTEVFLGNFDLIVVPGLAFDKKGFRLGYGGGYYDGFLKEFPEAHHLAIAYPFQVLEKIPVEDHDVKLDELLYGL